MKFYDFQSSKITGHLINFFLKYSDMVRLRIPHLSFSRHYHGAICSRFGELDSPGQGSSHLTGDYTGERVSETLALVR